MSLPFFDSSEIIALVAIAAGFLILFVPVVAWTTRHIVRDISKALAERRSPGMELVEQDLRALGRQVDRLGARLDDLEGAITQLRETGEGDRQLRSRSGERDR